MAIRLPGGSTWGLYLFGWGAHDIPGGFPRTSFRLGDLLVGAGHASKPQEGPAPRWTISFRVADAGQSGARAPELGGSVLLPPIDVPVGRFAIVADPAGASFSVTAVSCGPVRGVDGS
jgi:predicted enzyme related to lactoylglutathione lyase